MNHVFRASLALLVLLLAGCAAPAPKPRQYAPLILISIDGFRADYFDRHITPNLAALAAAGVRAQAMRPSFPSLTFPNHYTLVTGLYPDHHGIINNRFTDPASGRKFVYTDASTTSDPAWWGSEPIWVGAERQGKRAATMFWPGSDVAIDGVRPQYWKPFDRKVGPEARVDQVLAWIDLPAGQRPDFITLYFDAVDHVGHHSGPDSSETNAAIATIDRALGHLLDGLRQRGLADKVNLVIVSDHGQTTTTRDKRTYLDDVLPLADVEVINYGILAGIAPRAGKTAEVERALLAPHPHMQCWRKSELPARLHYGTNPRIPPLLCLAADGGIVTWHSYESGGGNFSAGEHGYDNADPKMGALFIAHGSAFRHGIVVPEFDNVDVYPLLTRVLGIRPAANDGNPATANEILR